MKIRGWIMKAAMIAGILAVASGCTSPNSVPITPTAFSAVGDCDAAKVTVTDVHSFKDAVGAWRVVGVINNGSAQAVSKVVTGVETLTKGGQPADQGEDVSAYPLDLLPGAQAPFTAWIDRDIPGLDHFEVNVDECVLAEQEQRGQVDVQRRPVVGG